MRKLPRYLTLLYVSGKVFNRVLPNRMEDSADDRPPDQQAGFRKDQSCTDQIVTLRITVEQSNEWNLSPYINLLDYAKAFDSMDRRTLWNLPLHYGVSSCENRRHHSEFMWRITLQIRALRTAHKHIPREYGSQIKLPTFYLPVFDWILKTSTSQG